MNGIVSFSDLKALILKAGFIAIVALVSATVFNYLRPASLPWSWVPPPPVSEVIDELAVFRQLLLEPGTVLVDARPALFHRISHIPGSVNVPLDKSTIESLGLWRQSLSPAATIIIYCSDRHCSMADELAQKIIPLSDGLPPLIFSPGFKAWDEAGLPLESTLPSPPQEKP